MHTVIKTYKFRLYNSNKNKYLDHSIDIAAAVWNYCIALHKRYYRMYGAYLPANRLMKHITKVKKFRYPEWKTLGSQAIQDVVKRIDRSYKTFFTHVGQKRHGRKSPPKFKKCCCYHSITLGRNGCKFITDSNRVTIMGREYKYCNPRPIEGAIRTITIKRNNLGQFYLIVVTKQECNDVLPRAGKAAGIDFGLKHFLNFDNGTVIDSPQWYAASLSELRAAHRQLSRCCKDSRNRKRALRNLERIYLYINNRRRDWFFKLANQLVKEYSIICIETLNLDGMKHIWGRKISDLAFAEFISILTWVAGNTGTSVVKVNRWAASSKICHVCGTVNANLSLKDRIWTCSACHTVLDRDVNAAINIRNLGLAQFGQAS